MNKALEVDPSCLRVLARRASFYFGQGKVELAHQDMRRYWDLKNGKKPVTN